MSGDSETGLEWGSGNIVLMTNLIFLTLQSTEACEFPPRKMKQGGLGCLLLFNQVETICKDPHKVQPGCQTHGILYVSM